MHAYRIVWEDEGKAREIELIACYTLEAGVVTIDALRPTKVTLYDALTKRPSRTLPVHTPTGRRLLTDAYLASRESEPSSLEEEILAAHELRDGLAAVVA